MIEDIDSITDFEAHEYSLSRERYRQLKHFDSFTTCLPCSSNTSICKRRCFCYFCGRDNSPCECDSCAKAKFPCVFNKFPCNCNICKKIPDSKVIPKSLPIFRRLDLWVDYKYQTHHHFYPETAIFSTSLRRDIIGGSAIATHFAQNRFSSSHLKKLGVDENLQTKFDQNGLLPNFNENLKAWEEHKTIAIAIEKFRNKYHRFPPCFRERMDIKSVVKVNFFLQKFFVLSIYFKVFQTIFSKNFFSSETTHSWRKHWRSYGLFLFRNSTYCDNC
jgi:hypothetical protein